MKRRILLKSGLATAELIVAAQAGLLWPLEVLAGSWPSDAFVATTFDEAFTALFGRDAAAESDLLQLKAPDLAENGATVPVAVQTNLDGPFVLTLFSVENPTPAVGQFEVSARLDGYISTRIKMAQTSDVVAVITKGGSHYIARQRVEVTTGGCA